MRSPFKLLDAYTPADSDVFLGRDPEVAGIYDMVTKNRLMLLYGQSGTGKTSLVQCGLAKRFNATDWYPLFIRRQHDLNESLMRRLRQVSGEGSPETVVDILGDLYVTNLRPVYLVFDQLEELFILGSPEEQRLFAGTVQAVMASTVPCRVLFIIREEYLAHLYGFEKMLPTLFDRRLRVEPMSIAKVREVLAGSFRHFNIKVPEPAEKVYTLIADQVSGGRAGIQLPYLQVYLDVLYRERYAAEYPGGNGTEGDLPPVGFRLQDVQALGQIDNVLEKFLLEQQTRIQQTLRDRFPDIAPDAVKQVLDAFVSEEGTKRPVGFEWKDGALQPEARWAVLFRPMQPEALGACCTLLEQARLLRFADGQMELAHDALAALIDRQRSGRQRRLQDALKRLQNNYRDFRETGQRLSRRQLNSLWDDLPLLSPQLDPEVLAFVEESRLDVERAERAELEDERRKRRQARRVAIIGLSLAGIALIAFVLAWMQFLSADRAKIKIAQNALAAQRNAATVLKVEGKYADALTQLGKAEALAGLLSGVLRNFELDKIYRLRDSWIHVRACMAAGDSLAARDDLQAALVQYELARKEDSDARIESLIAQTNQNMESLFLKFRLNGEALLNAGKYAQAAQNLEKALRLKPGDPETERLLNFCRLKL